MPSRFIVVLALLTAATAARAQAPVAPADFPPDAKPLNAEALQARITGKVFGVKPAAGSAWRLQFQSSGFYFIDAGNFRDNGKWRIEESRLCTAPQTRPAACNEMRLAGEVLYMKRDSGEIVKFEPN